VSRGLSGETQTERKEIKRRQQVIRAAWNSKIESRRHVFENNLGVSPQAISPAYLLRA
jgi:hypothetical protein